MIIQCSACKTRYHYEEARFAGAPAKKIRCTKCAMVFEIRNPAVNVPPPAGFQPEETSCFGAPMPGSDDFNLDTTVMDPWQAGGRRAPAAAAAAPSAPAPPPAPGAAEARPTSRSRPPGHAARPRRASAPAPRLGKALARLHRRPGSRPDLRDREGAHVIGRAGGDILLNDPECSRQHAAIEVSDDKVFLVDLGSTNGTYVADRRVTQLEVENRSEFDVGSTTLMLIRTRKE